jgi:signal transduction histidine kinase
MIRKLRIFVTVILLILTTSCQDGVSVMGISQNEVAPSGRTRESYHQVRLQTSKDSNKILLLGLVASIFSSVLLFYQLSLKHKKERILEGYAAETRISQKLHDEIANEIYGCLLSVANEDVIAGVRREKILKQLDNIYMRARNISRENNDIDTDKRFPVQLKLMLSGYSSAGVNIIIKGINKIGWDEIESSKKIATYRILQELMVNMQKHSYANVVLVDFSRINKKIKIVYSDNGVGMKGADISIHNGLRNIQQRLQSIKGKAIFDTDAASGAHITLTFPANTNYV